MKTNKTLKIMVIVLVGLLAAVLIGSGLYLKGQYGRKTYFNHTTINGYDASGRTPEQLLDMLERDYGASRITLTEGGRTQLEGTVADYGYTINRQRLLSGLEDKLKTQKSSILVLIGSLMNGSDFTVTVPFVFSQDTFNAKVNAASMADARVENVNASLQYREAEKTYVIEPEVQGTTFNDADLQKEMKTQIDQFISDNNPKKDLTLAFPTELYSKPEIDSANADLNTQMNVYNAYCKAQITYQFGSQTQMLDWNTIKDWVIIENGSGSLSAEKISAYVTDLASRYNTIHYDRQFHTSLGTDITIPSTENDYGYMVDEEAERAQLLADIQSNTQVTREPVYRTQNDYGNPVFYHREGVDDLAGTYVEINLTTQHLWFYKDGALVVESDIVSGSVAKNAETKTGAFPLAYKESPSVLVGQDAADGYRTEVQYWMPFYDGQGLHDASWRSAFGGAIYQTNGSHGCVNLPPATAQAIYDNIDAGVAIIIYK